MNLPVGIAVIALVLLVGSAGVLYPLHGSIESARGDVQLLESELQRDATVHDSLMAAHREFTSLQDRIRQRAYRLCPKTPEAQHQFEGSLQETVVGSGLTSIRMDRRNEQQEAGHPCLIIDLTVDGDYPSLQRFLVGLERLPWVTRVLNLSIEAGGERRRIQTQVAVMLERSS